MNWRRFDTLGLRLFVLMWVALVASSLVALSLSVPMSEPPREATAGGPAAGQEPPLPALPSLPPGNPFQAGEPGPGGHPPPPPGDAAPPPGGGGPPALPRSVLWWDYGIRLLVIALAAALGARWLAAPMKRLSGAAGTLAAGLVPGRAPPQLDETHGTREVRDAAQAFNRMAQRLQEQFDARGLHMAATSHDLRTPLTRMRMRLESVADPAAQAAIADIHAMNALIDASLAVLREQREGNAASEVDLAALLQSLIDDLAEQGAAVTLAALPGGGVPAARVRAHPAALRRIVDNLVGNALRYGGSARLGVASAGAQVELWVDDDGPGIPPGLVEQAFQPWVRLGGAPGGDAAAPHHARGGQGLGLAISRDLAERDGGRLTLENRPAGGLRARLVLPAA